MKKSVIILMMFLSIFSCKDRKSENSREITTKDTVEVESLSKAYAELSIKEGGHWKGREYIDGTFKNVDSLKVPSEHTDHSWFIRYEGPGWENSQIGYRLYLDWRNAIDVFGKKVDSLVLPYVGQDGFDSYHEPSDWGLDILKAGKSMGIGGYGRVVADTVVHFQSVKNTFASVKNSEEHAMVNISYEDWKTGDESINLKAQLTIYPHDRFTKVELSPSKEVSGICTGIVKFEDIPLIKKEGKKWSYIATYGTQTLATPTDKLGMVVFYNLDELEEQKDGIDDHLIIFKPTTQILTYYLLAAWDQEPNGIKTKEDFITDLNKKLEELESTNVLK